MTDVILQDFGRSPDSLPQPYGWLTYLRLNECGPASGLVFLQTDFATRWKKTTGKNKGKSRDVLRGALASLRTSGKRRSRHGVAACGCAGYLPGRGMKSISFIKVIRGHFSVATQDEYVGVIGLGLLGSAITERLEEMGFRILGYDIDATARERARGAASEIAEDCRDLLARCGRCILSLPDSRVVEQFLQTFASHLREGQFLIDTTTGDPSVKGRLADQFSQSGCGYVEACVAGSSNQIRRGQAALLIGGASEVIQQVQDVLSGLSEKRFSVGPVGDGAKLKLVHNLILGLNRAVLSEGMGLAQKMGLDLGMTLKVLLETPAYSGVMATKGGKLIRRDYEPQAKLSQHLKDVDLILDSAQAVNARCPLSEIHRNLLQAAERLGFGDRDNIAIHEVFRGDADELFREDLR